MDFTKSAEEPFFYLPKTLMEDHEVWGLKLGQEEKRFDVGGFESYFKAFLTFALEDEEVGDSFRQYAMDLLSDYGGSEMQDRQDTNTEALI